MTLMLLGLAFTPVFLLVGYYVVTPMMMKDGYRRGLPEDRFKAFDGSQGAGSIDLAYFPMYFDVRDKDIIVSGRAPKSRHWQIGAFDGLARLIPAAYHNQKSMVLDTDRQFELRITARPDATSDPNVLDCSECDRGMILFRVLLPEEEIELPKVLTVAQGAEADS